MGEEGRVALFSQTLGSVDAGMLNLNQHPLRQMTLLNHIQLISLCIVSLRHRKFPCGSVFFFNTAMEAAQRKKKIKKSHVLLAHIKGLEEYPK